MVRLQENQRWKDYDIIQELGRGGMGVVYKAQQKSLQRTVAIKFSYSNYIDDERFLREMQIAAKLNHPRIPKIYDAGIENNCKYLVMDYINGVPLHVYLQENHLSLSQKLLLFIKICKVVRYAHRKGIVHRDLKPSNIMVTKNHEPMIIDFGLAKHIENENFDFTKTGDVVGTPNYMAPEQISGTRAAIDEQVDVYALGAILYEMISGQMMIHGSNLLQILCCIQDKKFLRLSQVADLPNKHLENVWAKAIAQKKCDRYPSLSAFITDIKNVCEGVHKKRISWPFIAMLVAVVAILCVSQYNYTRQSFLPKTTAKDAVFTDITQHIYEHKFEHAKQLIATSSFLNTTQKIRIAEAFYREGQYHDAKIIFDKVPAQFFNKVYYDSFIAYYLQQYNVAEKGFVQLLITNKKDAKYHYYLGLCYLHQKNYSHALAHLLEAEKSFNTNLQLLEYIAQIYLSPKYRRIKKAEEYLLRCLRIANNGAKYALLLGKIYTETKEYYKAFVYLKKSIDLNTSFEALQLLHEIPYREPRLRRLCYYSIMSNYKTEKAIKPTDLFNGKWASIEKHYQQNYISWLQGIKNRHKSIKTFLKPVNDTKLKKIIKDALINLRYSETFDNDIDNSLQDANNPPHFNTFLRETRSEVQQIKQREIYAKTYYQLVYMYRTNQYNDTQGVTSELLITMLHKEHSPFLKYLVVKAHLQMFGFEPIIRIANDENDDIWARIICCAVLRQHHLVAKVDVFQELLHRAIYVGQDLEFIQVLVAQSLYTVHGMKRRDTSYRYNKTIAESETKLLVYLWQQSTQKTSLAAALSLFGLYEETPESLAPWTNIEKTIFAALQSDDFDIKNYTHFVFWNSVFTKQKTRYFSWYKKALEDNREQIREIALYHIELYRERIGELMPQIEKCLASSVDRVRFRALFAWTFRQSKDIFFMDPLYQKRKDTFTALEHTSIVLFLFYKFFWDTRGQQINHFTIQNVSRFFSYLDENLHTLPPTSQCMISYTLSLVGIHPSLSDLQRIQNEDLLAYYLSQLHQEVRFTEEPGKINYLRFIPKTKKREKMYTARYFMTHESEKVRKHAVSSFLAFASQEKQRQFSQKALASTDVSLRKSTAHGLYLFLCNEWIDTTPNSAVEFFDMFSNRPLYLLLIDNFNRMQQFVVNLKKHSPQRFLYHKKNIAIAQQLNPEESIYSFVGSFFGTTEQAWDQMNNAVETNTKYEGGHLLALYNIYMLEMYTKNYPRKQALAYVQKMDVNKINTHLATKIGKVYLHLQLYPQALRMYEENFLYKSTEYAPFYGIIEDHCQMVYIYKKQLKTKSAHVLFDYLYELYRRKEWGHSSITKKFFSQQSRNIVDR